MDPFRKSISAFLTHAVNCTKTKKSPEGMTTAVPLSGVFFINGVMFYYDEQLRALEDQAINTIIKKYGKSVVSDIEISNLLKRFAALQAKTSTDQTSETVAHLHELVTTERTIIYPNHAVFLDEEIPSFSLGPVTYLQTEKIHSVYPDVDPTQVMVSEDYVSEISEPLKLPYQACAVKVICSGVRAHSLAQWYADIALSLLRLFLFKTEKTHHYFPFMGSTDPISFRQMEPFIPFIVVQPQQSAIYRTEATGSSNYQISKETAALLQTTQFESGDFESICNAIFFPKANSVAERINKALGWMTKARRSLDLPNRYLFFFTALEALLTQGKDEPVLEHMARNVATIIGKIDTRLYIYTKVKELYSIRSRLIHAGNIEVSESECNKLQQYVELTCIILIDTCLTTNIEDFQNQLKECSFGKPFKPKKQESTIAD